MNAYAGRVARVDLTTRKWNVKESTNLAQGFLGGRGVNGWILLNELTHGVDPLSPANIVVFGAGALMGTTAPAACYTSIGSKNLLTGGINYAHAGGHFAPAMKQAGFDNLVVSGRSERPVYLYLHHGKVELKDAEHLWGKTTWETQAKIHEELASDDLRFLTIGPAWWADHSFLGPKELAAMISEVTGSPMLVDDLFLIGQRLWMLKKPSIRFIGVFRVKTIRH